jgi:hypothetical protein
LDGGQGGFANCHINQSVMLPNSIGRLFEKIGETGAIPNRLPLIISTETARSLKILGA